MRCRPGGEPAGGDGPVHGLHGQRRRLTLVWGEPGGGTAKPAVERHGQTEVRVAVSTLNTVTIGGDLTVGNIGYGAMQLTGPKVWGEYPDRDQGVAPLHLVIDPIAAKDNATPQQVALAWQLRRTPNALPIPGTTSVQHLRENLNAAHIRLTEEELDAITALAPEEGG